MKNEHVRIHFHPDIYLTSEQAARYLNISIEKADQLLSAPDTFNLVQSALQQGIQESLNNIMKQMARSKWPSVMDRSPVRVDVNVELDSISSKGSFLGK
jgi:hypothetical protein